MTPLALRILLHYYCCPDDTERMDGVYAEAITYFVNNDMLQENGPNDKAKFSITDRGNAYIKYILETPLPQAVMNKTDLHFFFQKSDFFVVFLLTHVSKKDTL